MKTVLLVLVAVLGTAIHPHPARGSNDVDAEARAHYARGQALYDEARYEEALGEFLAGYELSGRPIFLFNMAECARLAKDPVRARSLYERYLREDPDGDLVAIARSRLEDMGVTPAEPAAQAEIAPHVAVYETATAQRITGDRPIDHGSRRAKPLLRRWKFWAVVGGVLALGGAAAYGLIELGGDDCAGCPVADLRP